MLTVVVGLELRRGDVARDARTRLPDDHPLDLRACDARHGRGCRCRPVRGPPRVSSSESCRKIAPRQSVVPTTDARRVRGGPRWQHGALPNESDSSPSRCSSSEASSPGARPPSRYGRTRRRARPRRLRRPIPRSTSGWNPRASPSGIGATVCSSRRSLRLRAGRGVLRALVVRSSRRRTAGGGGKPWSASDFR